jgi:hypothetical protein
MMAEGPSLAFASDPGAQVQGSGYGFASQALAAAPEVTPQKPTGQIINVVDPKTGETFGLDSSYIDQAQAHGYVPESAQHAGIRSYLDENKGLPGAAKVALRGLLDEATFGVGDVVADHGKDPYELAKWEALKGEHQAANIVGRVAGFGASLAYGSEFFKGAQVAGRVAERAVLGRAMEGAAAKAFGAELAYRGVGAEAKAIAPGLARTVLGSVAKYGAEGATLTAPKALAQLMVGDPERAAETFVWGALAGGALGGVAGLGSAALSRLPGIVASEAGETVAGKLRKFGDDQAVSALDLSKASAKKLRRAKGFPDAVKLAREEGFDQFAGDFNAMAEKITTLHDDAGKAIGEIRKAGGDKSVASFDEAYDTLLAPVKAAQSSGGKVGAGEATEKWLRKEVIGPNVNKWIESGGTKEGLTLEELHDFRRVIDGATKWDATVDNATNSLRKEVRGALNEYLDKKMVQAGKDVGADLLPAWKEANRRYQVLSILKENALNNVERGAANRRHSLTDYIGNTIGGIVGGHVGGPIGSAAGGYLGGEINNRLRRYAPAYMSKAAHGAADYMEGSGLAALESAFKTHGEQLDHVPRALSAMADGRALKSPVRETLGANILTRFLGDDNDDAMTFANKITALASDPVKIKDRIDAATAALHTDAPQVSTAVATKLAGVAQYLAKEAPKAPEVANPFVPKMPWKPSDAEMKAFNDKREIARDPYRAIDRLADGTLTKAHVDALRELAPRLYAEMMGRVMQYGASDKVKPLAYAQRMKLSMLTGVPLDRSIGHQAEYQAMYAAHAEKQAGTKPSSLKGQDLSTEIGRLTASQ